jgi:para-nitrobenzyl esterase
MKLLGIGASHATELPYVFGTLPDKVRKKDIGFKLGGLREAKAISARMQAHWLAFAQTGDPATLDGAWPRYDEVTRSTLIINTTDVVENDPEGEIRRVWGEGVVGFK